MSFMYRSLWAGKVAQKVKKPATKSDNLCSIPNSPGRREQLHKLPLTHAELHAQ